MLIGFIVVIVMILVIVGLMATGNSGGGTGVNQTKATKVVTEIGTLAQSLSFYKTTTGAGNFAGFNHALGMALLDGYVAGDIDTDTVTAGVQGKAIDLNADGDKVDAGEANVVTGATSQAVDTLRYVFSTNAAADRLLIHAVLGGTDTALNQAIGSTIVSKLAGGNMSVGVTGVADGTAAADVRKYVTNDVITVVAQ